MVRRDGTPWVGSTPAHRIAAWHKILADLQQHEDAVTFADLLRADVISAYCNGSPRARNIGARDIQNGEDYQSTVGDGSIPCITDVAIRALKLIAPDSDQIPLLEELKAQAEMRCAERCAARNAAVPAFSDFLGAKTFP